jgi:hypothetical protein
MAAAQIKSIHTRTPAVAGVVVRHSRFMLVSSLVLVRGNRYALHPAAANNLGRAASIKTRQARDAVVYRCNGSECNCLPASMRLKNSA